MHKSWTLGLCLLPFLVMSCVSTSPMSMPAQKAPDVLQRRVQTWLGMPREFLEKHWGLASNTKDMGLGLRYLQYRAKAKQKNSCSVTFTVDISGTVRGGQWTGDRSSCLKFVKGVPAEAPQQSLVTN